MELERNAIYEHGSYGDVVVVNIVRSYRSYDVDEDAGEIDSTQIIFSNEWDDYGVVPSTTKVEDVESFLEQVEKKKRTIEFVS